MNIFSFTGNLGQDAETKHLQSGTAICTFSVPVKKGFGDNQKTTWIRCNLWGKRVESLSQYLNKGTLVGVTGEFFMSEWEKDGVKNRMPEVDVKDITLLGSKQKEEGYGRNDVPTTGDDVPF